MKKIIVICLLVFFTATAFTATAAEPEMSGAVKSTSEWVALFNEVYVDDGIEPAVVEALRQGVVPVAIMQHGLEIRDLNPQDLVKAMYCAGISGSTIQEAAEALSVTDVLVVSGFRKSIGECGDWVVGGFVGLPIPSSSGVFASPSTYGFIQ